MAFAVSQHTHAPLTLCHNTLTPHWRCVTTHWRHTDAVSQHTDAVSQHTDATLTLCHNTLMPDSRCVTTHWRQTDNTLTPDWLKCAEQFASVMLHSLHWRQHDHRRYVKMLLLLLLLLFLMRCVFMWGLSSSQSLQTHCITRLQEYLFASDIKMCKAICLGDVPFINSTLTNSYNNTTGHV